MKEIYRKKVDLLLKILPYVTDEECFAVHGGTAINLFVNNLNRLSVDIDLTYIPLEDRNTSITKTNDALMRIANRVKATFHNIRIIPRLDICKITCESYGCQVKIEVNQTKRGLVAGEAQIYPLCQAAQDLFKVEVDARLVSMSQLYGGKIAAALSRQHPRDLFDIRHMAVSMEEAKRGFVFCLLGSDRPLYESFKPSLIDQSEAMVNQFDGMTDIGFSYDDFISTRTKLIADVNAMMTDADKRFLVGFELCEPDWEHSDYAEFADYPSVKWKLFNLSKLKKTNPAKLRENAAHLAQIFGI